SSSAPERLSSADSYWEIASSIWPRPTKKSPRLLCATSLFDVTASACVQRVSLFFQNSVWCHARQAKRMTTEKQTPNAQRRTPNAEWVPLNSTLDVGRWTLDVFQISPAVQVTSRYNPICGR